MGCSSSSGKRFKNLVSKETLEICNLLGLSHYDMERFFKLFVKCDVKEDNGIEFQEFFIFMNLQDNRISRKVFSCFSSSSLVTFNEVF